MFSSKLKILYGFIKSQFLQIRQAKSPIIIKNKIKKFLKLILLIVLSVIFLPLNFFLILISKFLLIRFAEIPTNRIGHFALETDLYLTKKKIDNSNTKKIDFFCKQYFDNYVCNKKLLNLFKKKIYFLPELFLYPIIFNCKNIRFFSKNYFIISKNKDRDVENIIYKTPTNIDFSKKELIQCEQFLENNGIDPINDKIITLIIRDEAYLNHKFSKDWSYHDYRDGEVDDYLEACKKLTDLGYYVFRMGEIVKKKINITDNSKIIDYATNGMRTELLDIYLAKKSFFCISNSTGWDALPQIFRRPILFSNYTPFGSISTFSKQFMFTTRHHFSKKLNRKLSLKEIFENGLSNASRKENYTDKNVVLLNNSKDEITESVLEMENFVKTKSYENSNYFCSDSKKFNLIFEDLIKKYKLQDEHGKILAKISSKFIERNKYLIS